MIPIRQALVGMVHRRVAIGPKHIAVPIELHHRASVAAHVLAALRVPERSGLNEQVAVFEEVRVLDALVLLPSVHHLPLRREQCRVVTSHRAEERIAVPALLRVTVNKPGGPLPRPCHRVAPGVLGFMRSVGRYIAGELLVHSPDDLGSRKLGRGRSKLAHLRQEFRNLPVFRGHRS